MVSVLLQTRKVGAQGLSRTGASEWEAGREAMPWGFRPVPEASMGRGREGCGSKCPGDDCSLAGVRERECLWSGFMRAHLASIPGSDPCLLCDLGQVSQHLWALGSVYEGSSDWCCKSKQAESRPPQAT